MLDFGILGINARNIKYIKKFNPKRSIRLANNKIKTKKFLWERWIPVAKNYWVIKDRKELMQFDFAKLPSKEFVVKPNKWSRWRWIHIVKLLNESEAENKDSIMRNNIVNNFFSKISNKTGISDYKHYDYLFKVRWNIKTDLGFKRILLDNIEWKNSMTVWRDKILIEEKLVPSDKFKTFCEHGLADIRVITFNLVPISAMIRIPTEQSGWKANLDKWAIAVGVDIATGKIYSHSKQVVKKHFPETHQEILKSVVEFWDDILLFSSQVQYFVNLWYLALDWVITDNWPKLLEMNGRWGIKIQNTTGIKLQNVLNKLQWLNIKNPEKWVEICKSLFSSKTNQISKSKLLYLSQEWNIDIWSEKVEWVNIKVSLAKSSNYVGKEIFDKIKSNNLKSVNLKILENNINLKGIKLELNEKLDSGIVVLWTDTTKDFFIKPANKFEKKINIFSEGSLLPEEEKTLHDIDEKIHKIWKQLILNPILKPVNYLQELDKFIESEYKYNPVFEYKFPSDEKILEIEKDLLNTRKLINDDRIKSRVKYLWDEKADELMCRLYLIRAYKEQNFKEILKFNKKLFGDFDKELLEESREISFKDSKFDENLLWDLLSTSEIRWVMEEYILNKGFENVKIIIDPTNLSRVSVVKSKIPKIKIKAWVNIKEKELRWVLAHEIDVHLARLINGQKTWWHIFVDWTGFYLKDEEWLAVNNAIKNLPEWFFNKSIYKKYFLLSECQKYDFVKIFGLVKFLYSHKNDSQLFATCFRLKKWIEDTSEVNKWAIFMKDKVYLDWYIACQKSEIDEKRIFLWKFKIDDKL